jgi:hypothetical protein
MKAITIWQPWASLIAVGAKRYETRSWETKYRGPIAIHSAKKQFDTNSFFPIELYPFKDALGLSHTSSLNNLPHGCIIATAELVNCWKIDRNKQMEITPTKQEILFGDWRHGRYAWELANVIMLEQPIKAIGKQGLWNWEVES